MALVNLDLIGSYAINRGYEWRLFIYHPGKVDGLLSGQLWRAYELDARLARFTFEQAVYDAQTDRTRIPVVLSAVTTEGLEPTGSGFYVYEIQLSLPFKNPQLLLAGKVHVLPTLRAL